jgi:putative inorganic carbon (HCO3(-)) transporter
LKLPLDRAAFYLTCGSLISILFSIAASQVLLGLALAVLLFSSTRLRLPPIKLPLLLFLSGTVIAWLASGHIREGTPQIRKFLLWIGVLVLVYSTFRRLAEVRAVVLLWAAVASFSALRSLFQFLEKYREAQAQHTDFYNYYVGERITGFMSHWMTFGGEEMIVLLLLAAVLFFSTQRRWKTAGWLGAFLLSISLVLGFTRSIFLLGVPVGLLYLFWFWHKWLVAAVPLIAIVAVLVSPAWMKSRVTSIFQPHGQTDSNMHREILRRTGIAMIEAHPWLGLGPEETNHQFEQYVPADIPKPLPVGWYGHLHNIYLQYAAERGIPVLLIFLWMIGQILWDFGRTLFRKMADPEARFVLHGAIAVILALLAEGFLENNLGDSEVLTMFLATVAFGYVAKGAAEVAA